MKRLYGTVVPIVTPLTEEDQVDVLSMKRLVDHVIEGGLSCLYPCGTTGEMMYLTLDERKLAAETVVEQTAGRVPVFVHAGAWNLKDTLSLAHHAERIGADGIGVVTPVFYKLSDQGIIDYFTEIAGSVSQDFPVYLYAIPQNAVNDINPAICEAVVKQCPNVVGIKYSCPDFTKLQQFLLVNQEHFDVLAGPDHLFEALCAVGGNGVVSGNAMIIREHYQALWKALEREDYRLATRLQRRTNMLNALMCEENNIAAYKVLLKREGVIRTANVRRPMERLTALQEESLVRRMDELEYKKVIL